MAGFPRERERHEWAMANCLFHNTNYTTNDEAWVRDTTTTQASSPINSLAFSFVNNLRKIRSHNDKATGLNRAKIGPPWSNCLRSPMPFVNTNTNLSISCHRSSKYRWPRQNKKTYKVNLPQRSTVRDIVPAKKKRTTNRVTPLTHYHLNSNDTTAGPISSQFDIKRSNLFQKVKNRFASRREIPKSLFNTKTWR